MSPLAKAAASLLAVLAAAPGAAAAAEAPAESVAEAPAAPPAARHQITIDVDAASLAVTYAGRVQPGLMVGGGIGAGPSPMLGAIYASDDHFKSMPGVSLVEVVALQGFARLDPWPWLKLDAGVRTGLFAHGSEDFSGGLFVAAFAAPAVGWRWLWLGPRLSAGALSESGGPASAFVAVDYAVLRFAIGW
jgi:hypothetical protein